METSLVPVNKQVNVRSVFRAALAAKEERLRPEREVHGRYLVLSMPVFYVLCVAAFHLSWYLATSCAWGIRQTTDSNHTDLIDTIVSNVVFFDLFLLPFVSMFVALAAFSVAKRVRKFRYALRQLKLTWNAKSIRGIVKAQREEVQRVRVERLELEVSKRDYVAEALAAEQERLRAEQARVEAEIRANEERAQARRRFAEALI